MNDGEWTRRAFLGGAGAATLASASLGGVWLTSFLIAAANTALAGAVLRSDLPGRAVALAAAAICIAAGPAWFVSAAQPASAPSIRVALVQPGTVEASAEREQAGEDLTRSLAGRQVDLVEHGRSMPGGSPAVAGPIQQRRTRPWGKLAVRIRPCQNACSLASAA